VLVAKNGAGKSNILEAIQLISTGRSTKTHHHLEVIKKGQEEAYIEATLTDDTSPQGVSMKINKKGKKILLNKKPLTKTTDLLKGIVTVYFSPEDDYIFSGTPAERRLFLDTLLSKMSPDYLQSFTMLKHTVKLMNHHHKHNMKPDKDLLELYHDKIVRESQRMIQERQELLFFLENKINLLLKETGLANIKMTYQSSLENMKKEAMLDRELRYRESCYGAHRDDISITYNDQDVRRGISLGERRLLGVFLRVAEKEIWIEKQNRRPLLLLDDAFLGIDEEKQKKLSVLVSKGSQTIMTATQEPTNLFIENMAYTMLRVEAS
jgi:DNA replication and repair protein RecF